MLSDFVRSPIMRIPFGRTDQLIIAQAPLTLDHEHPLQHFEINIPRRKLMKKAYFQKRKQALFSTGSGTRPLCAEVCKGA